MSGPDTPLSRRPRKLRKIRSLAALAGLALAAAAGIAGVALTGAFPWLLLPAAALIPAWRILVRPGAVPVLTFHSISDAPGWLPWAPDISIGSELFDRMLGVLERSGCRVITTGELVEARRAGRALPHPSVVLHLDDGYLDNWVAALPLLRKHGMPATLFLSTDFIDPGDRPRPTLEDGAPGQLQWDGYLNAAEIRAMRDSGLIDFQAHGTDHGRVATGPRPIGTLTADNWRHLAWVQWSATPGDKSRWHLMSAPEAVPLGSPVPENGPSLTSRRWRDGRRETLEEFTARVEGELRRCRTELEELLGRPVTIFCWPQNVATPRSLELARRAGFLATTGGWRENRPGEDPFVISRIHIRRDVLGFPCPAADLVYFRAQIGSALGNDFWYPVLLLGDAARKLVYLVRGAPRKSQP